MEKVWVHVSHACVHHKTQISTGPKTWEKLLKLYILLWAGVMHLCQSFSSSHTRNIRIGTTPKVAKRPSSATSLHLWLVFIEVVVLDKLSGNQSIQLQEQKSFGTWSTLSSWVENMGFDLTTCLFVPTIYMRVCVCMEVSHIINHLI